LTVIRGRQDGAMRLTAKWRRSGLLLRASWLLTAGTAVWFAVNLVHPVGPIAPLWSATPLIAVIGAGIFWQTSRNAALPEPARLFWRRLTPVAALVGMGQAAQIVDTFTAAQPDPSQPGPGMLICSAIAVLIIIYALYRLPTGKTDRADALQVSLDAGTVMLATAVFVWHFATRHEPAYGSATVGSLVLAVTAGFIVFILMKVLFSDYAVIDAAGVGLLAAAILVGVVETMLQPLLAGYGGRLVVTQVGIPLIYLLAGEAAARQGTTPLGVRRERGLRRRSSVLAPYAAVALVDILLIWVACFEVSDIVVVAAAAVALTAFVVMRQVLALVANQQLMAQLDHSANHDPLTGLPNRSYYNNRLQLAITAPGNRLISLALLDLDDFKMVNDTLGHEMGDVLLVEVARRLRGCVRPADTVARLGGDEFVVLIEGAEPADLQQIVNRMVAAFGEPVRTADHELPVRASIGIADGHSGDDPSVLLRQADMAMYAAKALTGTAALHYDDNTAAEFLTKPDRDGREVAAP
jgi:diguanylate cyclase (GGDEF)-like protein